jgi:hypothetical protein
VEGKGKESGLYPPFVWSRRTKGLGFSFRLDPINQGVIASFWLEPENIGSLSFLQVGACKSRGYRLLRVGAIEYKDLYIDPSGYQWPPTYSNWLILAVLFLIFESQTSRAILRP